MAQTDELLSQLRDKKRVAFEAGFSAGYLDSTYTPYAYGGNACADEYRRGYKQGEQQRAKEAKDGAD